VCIVTLKCLALPRCVHKWTKGPLDLGLFLIQSAQTDLVELHFEARSHFLQFYLFALLLKHVMAEGDEVVLVGEGDHPLGVILWDREDVLEDV
jgi:hypothetical protein